MIFESPKETYDMALRFNPSLCAKPSAWRHSKLWTAVKLHCSKYFEQTINSKLPVLGMKAEHANYDGLA